MSPAGRRFGFTADQRRRLALAGQELSPDEPRKYCQLVKPATILAWFGVKGARKYDSWATRKFGRPRKAPHIRQLVIKMAEANLGWSYTKIRDALRTGLKIEIGRTTVANILFDAGIDPASEREKKRTWKRFMNTDWEPLYACDLPFGVATYGQEPWVQSAPAVPPVPPMLGMVIPQDPMFVTV